VVKFPVQEPEIFEDMERSSPDQPLEATGVSQRRAKLFALGGVAIFLTTLLAYWLFRLLPLSSTLGASTGAMLLALPLIFRWSFGFGFLV